MTRDWIVIAGQLIDSTTGGGYEFFGPFTEAEAEEVRNRMAEHSKKNEARQVQAVQLLGVHRREFDRKATS